MSAHFLVFGTTPELSLLEWQAVFPSVPLRQVTARVAEIEWADLEDPADLVEKLGGLVKVLRAEEVLKPGTQEEIYEQIADYLATHENKPEFGLAEYGSSKIGQLSPQELKNILKSRGISARFLRQEGQGLSAAVLLHQKKVIELNLIHEADGRITLAKTLSVQNIDDWTMRDRGKPYADRKKGMLPPKIARVMANIGIGQRQNPLVYDPFCGTGTVLMEAALLGAQIVGSDLDATAVAGAKSNLVWLGQTYPAVQPTIEAQSLQVADATHTTLPHLRDKVDVIVTEPFLGKPKPQAAMLKNMFRGLEKLYLGALKHWTHFLKPGATIVMVWPMVEDQGHQYSLLSLIDKLASAGYTLQVNPPVRYARPLAIVQRQIIILNWQPPTSGLTN